MSKAAIKSAVKTALTAARDSIAESFGRIDEEFKTYQDRIARHEVSIAVQLSLIQSSFKTAKDGGVDLSGTAGIKTKDWREFARDCVAGTALSSQQTMYRWTNSGTVVRVLLARDVSIPDTALVGSFVPLYRILTDANVKGKTDEDRETAAAVVADVYSELLAECGTETDDDGNEVQIAPTFDEVHAAAEAASPTNRGTKTDEDDEDEDESDEDESEDEDEDERRESAAGLVVADAASVDAARGPTDAIARGLCDEFGVSRAAVDAIMSATLRLADEWTVSVLRAVLGHVPTETAADESADEDDAAADAAAESASK